MKAVMYFLMLLVGIIFVHDHRTTEMLVMIIAVGIGFIVWELESGRDGSEG